MRTVFEWGKAYLVWDVHSFKSSDLRTCASNEHQRVGEPLVVGRCELPVTGGITFPLQAHYDAVIIAQEGTPTRASIGWFQNFVFACIVAVLSVFVFAFCKKGLVVNTT